MGSTTLSSSGYILASWWFLRLLGVVYCIAFASFARQVWGLVGDRGISPAAGYLDSVRASYGRKAYWLVPTLAWIKSGDRFLMALCLAGAILGGALALGYQTTLALIILWALYLSLVGVGQIFLSYQWDSLLLEAGFLSIFLAPPSLLVPPLLFSPSPWIIFLFHWLLFRLMWMSGALKIISGDPTWRSLMAMSYHYETQPLPNPVAWYIHKAPMWFQKFSTLFALICEGLIPFLYFAPVPSLRLIGAGFTFFLMILIEGTGNFAFFNLLTASLALLLINDPYLFGMLPQGAQTPAFLYAAGSGWGNIILIPLTVILVAIGLIIMVSRVVTGLTRRKGIREVMDIVVAFRLVNSYGLFVSMTTVLPVIVVEGSADGVAWLPYEFKYKPGDLYRSLPIVAPNHPRLDWQMWFLALRGSTTGEAWFLPFVVRLLQNSTPVLGLLEKNPFSDKPPVYIRALLYDYHFSSSKEKAESGVWWRREQLGVLLPPVSIRGDIEKDYSEYPE